MVQQIVMCVALWIGGQDAKEWILYECHDFNWSKLDPSGKIFNRYETVRQFELDHLGANGGNAVDTAKENKKHSIIGTWILESLRGDAVRGTTLEFTSEGTINVVVMAADGTARVHGTYKITAGKIHVTVEQDHGECKETLEIKKLTETALILIGDDGREEIYKKK